MNTRVDITAAIAQILAELGASEIDPAVEASAKPEFGDWSTPAALRAARVLRKPPIAIANEMCSLLAETDLDVVAKWTVSPPGYVNAHLADPVWVPAVIAAALALDPAIPLHTGARTPLRTLVEHTNTNPNKAAHIGHLRNACIGDSVARILRRIGGDVEVQNYIDDTGVQVADVTVGVRELGMAQQDGEPFDQYCSRVYVEVCRRYEDSPELLEKRRAVLHALEAGDNEMATFVKRLTSRIVDCHLATMARFDIGYDLLAWESDILHLGFWQRAFEQLSAAGAIVSVTAGKHAGCWVMPADSGDVEGDEAKVFIKSDGVATYTAKDTAYQLWKFGLLGKDFRYRTWPGVEGLTTTTSNDGDVDADARFGGARQVVNVIDSRQAYPQGIVKRALARLGHAEAAKRSIHLAYEVVALSPGAARELGIDTSNGGEKYALSGRTGIEVRADELLDRAIEHVRAKAATADDATVRCVAAGAVRYYLQRFTLTQIIAFDFDEALRTNGDSGVYLQYAHARAAGILRKVADDGGALSVPQSLEPVERALLHCLDAYRYALTDAAAQLAPSVLCNYTFTLAATLSDFYEHTPAMVREQDATVRRFRRHLVAATKATLADALHTLGIAAPDAF